SARKGESVHRAAGNAFFVAMLIMCAFATYLSILRQPATIIGGIFTAYLVATAWQTVRRPAGSVGGFEKVALLVGAACAAGGLILGSLAPASPSGGFFGFPAALFYVFAAIATLAVLLDLRMIRRGGISGAPRVARHLWRMCLALFVATGSFFIGQQKVMPEFMRGAPILVLFSIAPLLLMVFWLLRVRFSAAYHNPRHRPPVPRGRLVEE